MTQSSNYTQDQLNKMDDSQLQQVAQQFGIQDSSKFSKQELVQQIVQKSQSSTTGTSGS